MRVVDRQPVETRYSSTANTCLTTPAAAVRANPQSRMKAQQSLRAGRMHVAFEEQLRVEVDQDPRHQENRAERTQAACLRHPILLHELERAAAGALRVEALERDQRDDEDCGEAPGDLGRLSEPAQTLDAPDEADHERDEERIAGPAGYSAEPRPGDVEAVADSGLLAVEDLRRGSCKGDIEEDPDEEERVQADRNERHVEEPGAIHRIEPGLLKDPESRNENEAAGRDDREPEESKVATDELEARAHQPCAVDEAACHGRSIGFARIPQQPRKGVFARKPLASGLASCVGIGPLGGEHFARLVGVLAADHDLAPAARRPTVVRARAEVGRAVEAPNPDVAEDAADQPGFHRRRDRFDDYEIVHVSPPPRSPASSPSFCSRAVAICSCISSS